jgi:hypothetical protein
VPVRNVLVRDAGGNIKHDDTTLSCCQNGLLRGCTLDVIPISQASEFFLSSGIPRVETDLAKVGVEGDGMDYGQHTVYKITYPQPRA